MTDTATPAPISLPPQIPDGSHVVVNCRTGDVTWFPTPEEAAAQAAADDLATATDAPDHFAPGVAAAIIAQAVGTTTYAASAAGQAAAAASVAAAAAAAEAAAASASGTSSSQTSAPSSS
ncbi:MAG TPA: hypothetical protein VMR97_07950 [Acidimicrobiales bacterium]|nr:hypothetical protein [Acidimicrobiales bacterium]